jgi:putative tryptophan/tyrosine transport system substrate-binding protein
MSAQVYRREFISLLAGTAAAWPLAARAQQRERMRRVGVLTPFPADDSEGQARLTAFVQALQQAGWTLGQNLRLDYRWGDGKAETMRKHAAELAALAPDVILANSSAAVSALLQVTRTVPIVFAAVADPVGAGYVESLARPGGNATGFTALEYSFAGKWLELMKEIAPRITRLAVLRDSAIAAGPGQFGVLQAFAPSLGLELRPVDLRDAGEIERSINAFAQDGNGGLIVTGSPAATAHRDLIVSLATRNRLPAVFYAPFYCTAGGLICYGVDFLDQFRRAAGYVDRILRGEKPTDLPVQAPVKYELVLNLKTARALGLAVPDTLLARADEDIWSLQSASLLTIGPKQPAVAGHPIAYSRQPQRLPHHGGGSGDHRLAELLLKGIEDRDGGHAESTQKNRLRVPCVDGTAELTSPLRCLIVDIRDVFEPAVADNFQTMLL